MEYELCEILVDYLINENYCEDEYDALNVIMEMSDNTMMLIFEEYGLDIQYIVEGFKPLSKERAKDIIYRGYDREEAADMGAHLAKSNKAHHKVRQGKRMQDIGFKAFIERGESQRETAERRKRSNRVKREHDRFIGSSRRYNHTPTKSLTLKKY